MLCSLMSMPICSLFRHAVAHPFSTTLLPEAKVLHKCNTVQGRQAVTLP